MLFRSTRLTGVGDDGYYRENGAIVTGGKGLVKDGDDYYFVVWSGKVAKDSTRAVQPSQTNGLLPSGTYHFGADGKMTTQVNGVGDDGYYRENGAIVTGGKGLVKDGDDYYFVVWSGKVAKDSDRAVQASQTNGLLPSGTYHFGPDGKLVFEK